LKRVLLPVLGLPINAIRRVREGAIGFTGSINEKLDGFYQDSLCFRLPEHYQCTINFYGDGVSQRGDFADLNDHVCTDSER
jgi:hypothetical protein